MRLDDLLRSSHLWSNLTLLSSLSCNFGTWQQSSETDDQDPRETAAFIQIIEVMPATIRNLELINIDVHDNAIRGHIHFCDVVARRIPQLRKLRLENSLICPSVFNVRTACPDLEEIVVNNSSWYFFEDCASEDVYRLRRPEMRERGISKITDAALRAMRYMPEILKYVVYTDGPCRDDQPRGSKEFFCNLKLDLIEKKTTIYPYRGVTMDLSEEADTMTNPILKWIRYRDVHTKVETDLVGDLGPRKTVFIEQPLSWVDRATEHDCQGN